MRYEAQSAVEPAPISSGRIRRGLAGFAFFTVVGTGLLFLPTVKAGFTEVASNLSPGFFLLAVVGTFADLLIGAIRYQIFLRRIRPGTSLGLPIRADLANRFLGAVTPSQSGGAPAQLFILHKGGIPMPETLSFLVINLVSTLLFLLVGGSVSAWVLKGHFAHGVVDHFIQWGFVAFLGALGLMIVGLVRPDLVVRASKRLLFRLERREGWWTRMTRKAGKSLVDGVERYQRSCVEFIQEAPLLPAASFALTALMYLNKFTLAWFVMRGLGIHGDYATMVAVQALLHFIIYLAPTPGGSGIAELSTGALMSLLLPGHLLGPFTLACRFFLLYLPAAAGAWVFARALRPVPGVRATVRKAAAAAPILLLLGTFLWPAGLRAQEVGDTLASDPLFACTPSPSTGESPGRLVEGCREPLQAWLVYGTTSRDQDRKKEVFDRAVEVARGLVNLFPNEPEAHYLLAISLGHRVDVAGLREKIGMADETRKQAEIVLAMNPDHPGAHHVMGRLCAGAMRLGRIPRFLAGRLLGSEAMRDVSWETAEQHFLRAWELEPSNPRHAMELGALYTDTDRPDLAREVLRQAVAIPALDSADSLVALRATVLLAEVEGKDDGV